MRVNFIYLGLKVLLILSIGLSFTSCVTPPPRDVDNICTIFDQYPSWYKASLDVEKRWLIPVPVQMAIIHQESKFDATARPPRRKFMRIIPWKRPSSAYGYTQALHDTWDNYRQTNGSFFSSRGDFTDGVDFIGWYANQAHRRAGIQRTDAYSLYLAYHEGVGGYLRKSYLKKNWLISVAHKVKAKASIYALQLRSCHRPNKY